LPYLTPFVSCHNLLPVSHQMGVDAVGVLRVEVTDNGAGIAPEDQKKVFGEFTQFNKNELQGGGRLIC